MVRSCFTHEFPCSYTVTHHINSSSSLRRFGGDVWAADKLLKKEADAEQVCKRGGDFWQRKSTLDASVLGLDGGAVPSLGGGAMNLASLLSGGGLQTQINPLASVLGGTTGLLATSGVPKELSGLCVLLGNQQSRNVSLTNLQVVELQRAVSLYMWLRRNPRRRSRRLRLYKPRSTGR